MKGRRLGTTELTLEDMKVITEMTNNKNTRSEIADAIGRCNDTIYRYQKKLDLI